MGLQPLRTCRCTDGSPRVRLVLTAKNGSHRSSMAPRVGARGGFKVAVAVRVRVRQAGLAAVQGRTLPQRQRLPHSWGGAVHARGDVHAPWLYMNLWLPQAAIEWHNPATSSCKPFAGAWSASTSHHPPSCLAKSGAEWARTPPGAAGRAHRGQAFTRRWPFTLNLPLNPDPTPPPLPDLHHPSTHDHTPIPSHPKPHIYPRQPQKPRAAARPSRGPRRLRGAEV
jgi:hypothetical protein